jgi:hypothetical protein
MFKKEVISAISGLLSENIISAAGVSPITWNAVENGETFPSVRGDLGGVAIGEPPLRFGPYTGFGAVDPTRVLSPVVSRK